MKNIKTLVTNEPFNKQFRRCIILMFESALFMKFAVYMQATFHRREWIWDLNKKSFRLDGLLDIARSPLIFFAQIISPIFILEMESRPCGRRGISVKLEKWNKVMQCSFEEKYKHCQRHNGPEGWVLLTKVTDFSHITRSKTKLDQISSPECWPRTKFKISTSANMSISTKLRI